MNSLMAVPVIL